MVTHSVILDTTNVLLYPVATPGLLDAKYNRFLIPTDTSAPTKICLNNKITAVPEAAVHLMPKLMIGCVTLRSQPLYVALMCE